MRLEELDRYTFSGGNELRRFDRWLDGWRERWLAGERITVLVAVDYSHVLVVRDPAAAVPSALARRSAGVQLELPGLT